MNLTDAQKYRISEEATKRWGKQAQLCVVLEETTELINAISSTIWYITEFTTEAELDDFTKHVFEEIADFRIVCQQLDQLISEEHDIGPGPSYAAIDKSALPIGVITACSKLAFQLHKRFLRDHRDNTPPIQDILETKRDALALVAMMESDLLEVFSDIMSPSEWEEMKWRRLADRLGVVL